MPKAELRLPRYLPNGYSLWKVIQGAEAAGFGFSDSDDQYSVTYACGKMPEAKDTALTVFKGPLNATSLAATTGHSGEEVDLGIAGVTAIYHDGMWFIGPGDEQRVSGKLVLHWERGSFHSLTVRAPSDVWGVRGPKSIRLDKQELILVARSLID